jgi:putative NADH-flavin reductase
LRRGAFGEVAEEGLLEAGARQVIVERLLKNGFTDMRACEEQVRAVDLDWTIFRPPQLVDKAATGRYRTATDINLRGGRRISRADLAACMLGLVADDASVRHHVSVAY